MLLNIFLTNYYKYINLSLIRLLSKNKSYSKERFITKWFCINSFPIALIVFPFLNLFHSKFGVTGTLLSIHDCSGPSI